MIGAIVGDVAGSVYEFNNKRNKDIELFGCNSFPTDDTFMTCAVLEVLLDNGNNFNNKDKIQKELRLKMKEWYKKHRDGGYGGRFLYWLRSEDQSPYNSYGNGAAMRISPVGLLANSEEEVKTLSKIVTEISHNHKEGLKGAECVAMCVYYARNKESKKDIEDLIYSYYPRVKNFNLRELQAHYGFDESCQGSVPEALYCFLISNDFEDCIRTSICIGGDSDTIACIACSIASEFYGIPDDINKKTLSLLSDDIINLLNRYENR